MHQKMERMSQGARLQVSAAPPVKRNERLQLSRKADFRNQGALVNFSDHKPQRESRHLSRWCCSLLSETFLLHAWGHGLLFNLEGRGINAYSTLPKSRLLNYYFLGSKDRSQQTRPAPFVKVSLESPWVGTTASAKVSMSICPFITSSYLIQTSSSVWDMGRRFGLSLELD